MDSIRRENGNAFYNQAKPLLQLNRGQFAQLHIVQEISHIHIYDQHCAEAFTTTNEKIAFRAENLKLPKLVNPAQIAEGSKKFHWTVTQLQDSHEYTLMAFVRGVGGGNNAAKEGRKPQSASSSTAQATPSAEQAIRTVTICAGSRQAAK